MPTEYPDNSAKMHAAELIVHQSGPQLLAPFIKNCIAESPYSGSQGLKHKTGLCYWYMLANMEEIKQWTKTILNVSWCSPRQNCLVNYINLIMIQTKLSHNISWYSPRLNFLLSNILCSRYSFDAWRGIEILPL